MVIMVLTKFDMDLSNSLFLLARTFMQSPNKQLLHNRKVLHVHISAYIVSNKHIINPVPYDIYKICLVDIDKDR